MDTLLAAARFVQYAAAIQLFGTTTFYWLLLPNALRGSQSRAAHLTAQLSAALLLLSAVAWLMATAGSMGDGLADAINPQLLWTVLSQTSFGNVWGPRILLCTLALVASLSTARWSGLLLVLLATLALGSLGLVGHAAMDVGLAGLLNESLQVLHLLSSGFWLGALVPLLFLIPLFADPGQAGGADEALRRFSGLGHLAVAVLMLTGVANSWFIIGGGVPDFGSPYVQLLAVKIAIACTMCVLAVINRYVFVPRIPDGGPGARQLARGTIAEIVLGAAVILLVSFIGTMSPA